VLRRNTLRTTSSYVARKEPPMTDFAIAATVTLVAIILWCGVLLMYAN